jgi:uncharacterized protein YdeI (YjbR/CyaY-like superfamily)
MVILDKRIDDYIGKSAEFARPILEHLRYLVHQANPDAAARATFDKFSTTNKREYVDWINEAKTGETRERRLETAIEWMAEGKVRNWKYVRK